MEDLYKICNIFTCMVGSLFEAHLFGSMKEDEECDMIMWIDKVVTRKIVVLEKTIQTCARMHG